MNNQELITNAIAKMSNEEKAQIFPPINRKNFVVRKSWLGRNQVITFTNNKNQVVTYNHDTILSVQANNVFILSLLRLKSCFADLALSYYFSLTKLN